MSFVEVFKKILKVGETVGEPIAVDMVTAVNPAAGLVVSSAINAVVKAEHKGGTTTSKKAAVMQEVLPIATSALSDAVKASHPGAAVDPGKLSDAVSTLVDGVVGMLNSVKAPSQSAQPPTTTSQAAENAGSLK